MGSFSIPVYRRRRARADAEPRVRFRREEGMEGHADLRGPRDAAADDAAAAVPLPAASPPCLIDSLEDAGAGGADEALQPVRLPAGLLLNFEKEEEMASVDALDDPVS